MYCDDLDRSHRTSWGYGKREAWEYDEDEPDPQLEFMYCYFPDHVKRSSNIYRRWLAENDIDPEEAPKPTPPDEPPQPPLDWLAELGLLTRFQKLMWMSQQKKKGITYEVSETDESTEEEWD